MLFRSCPGRQERETKVTRTAKIIVTIVPIAAKKIRLDLTEVVFSTVVVALGID